MSLTLDIPIDHLTVDQRLELMDRLWTSIQPDAESAEWPDWHPDEVERRIAEADAHPEASIPLEDLRRDLLARRS